jgi:hypothetical protein
MKVIGNSSIEVTATILVLYVTQTSLANLCNKNCYDYPCYDESDSNNRCTYCDGWDPRLCRMPTCGDSCSDEKDCFGSYYNDSCTSCDTSDTHICVKPGYGTICTYDDTCSGADDGCTKCDMECKLSCSSSNTPLCELLSYYTLIIYKYSTSNRWNMRAA